MNKPQIVCLCGSTRFMETFHEAARIESLKGKIVLTVSDVLTYNKGKDPQLIDLGRKNMLDELHMRKIDISDEILVLNVNGYIGKSTRNEIKYATKLNKTITYWEDQVKACTRFISFIKGLGKYLKGEKNAKR